MSSEIRHDGSVGASGSSDFSITSSSGSRQSPNSDGGCGGSGDADKMGDERGGGDNKTGVDCSGVEKRPGDCGSEKLWW